jgi:clan AA aspartic protease
LTYVKGTVHGKGRKKRQLKFLVDSGASYTLLPEEVWRELGLKPKRKPVFILADGTEIERDVSECYIELPQGDGHSPVVLGEEGDDALLGAVTLENLGLILNPLKRKLQPMTLRLA